LVSPKKKPIKSKGIIIASLALGLRPRQGFVRLRAKKEAWESGHMLSKSARLCEGIDPHTPKGTPTLGVRVPMDFQMFRK